MGLDSHRSHAYRTQSNQSSSSSNYSDSSDHSRTSRSTAPTVYSVRKQYETVLGHRKQHSGDSGLEDPRDSTETYASTIPSEEDIVEASEYEVPDYRHERFSPTAVPATPPDFAELFPSSRRLLIGHDDTTIDGNMNLRVDTAVSTVEGRKRDVTLFHLRMQDLKNRQFSLRRYCRDSGREVCHSSRKYTEPSTQKRPGFQRSLSSALSTLRLKSEPAERDLPPLRRPDHGYGSTDDDKNVDSHQAKKKHSSLPMPTNTTQLEFSNYTHLEVKRRGAKSSKRYEFEYWGRKYQWKVEVRKDGRFKEISYHLFESSSSRAVAHMVPEPMTSSAAVEEQSMAGWVSPCSMWISDPAVLGGLTDAGDAIVATGLIALVDDCIKRKWHNKRTVQLSVPTKASGLKNADFVGPKRLIDEVFNRRGQQPPEIIHY